MTPRDYQQKGAAFLASYDRALLGDEMGLGKTAQAITAFTSLQPRGGRVLIVCPASLRLNWAAEIRMWAPGATYQIAVDTVSMGADVVIVSYNLRMRYAVPKARLSRWLIDPSTTT
jgi:SNF2 family DNA or RNA helicase